MIRWEVRVLKQLTKFTYKLETGEEDDQTRGLKIVDKVHILPGDRRRGWSDEVLKQFTKFTYSLETGEKDDQMRGLKTSSRTFWRWVKRMIRWEVFKQLIKFTYFLVKGEGTIRWEILKQLTKFTHPLETDEEDDQMRGLKTFDKVHVLPGDRQRGWSDERS